MAQSNIKNMAQKIILDEKQQEEINLLLNYLPISELNKVQKIINVLNRSKPYHEPKNKEDD